MSIIPTFMNLQEGGLFAERYQLSKLLGRGGFSEVWLAEDKMSGVDVALKVYAPYGGLDEDGAMLFSKEFALVFNINHTNLLTPTHYDTFDRSPYLILPYCKRGSVDSLVGKADESTVLDIIHDVAAGLSCLHEQEPPIIHQDIKPDNILLNDHGDYLITDFGISTKIRSTLRKSAIEGDEPGSQSGGTYAYMGPERFSRQSAPVKASDIWSLGAMAFELLDGRPPFDNLGGSMQKNGAEIPSVQTPISQDLQKLIDACLALEPWDRPTAKKLVEWTESLRNGQHYDIASERKSGKSSKTLKTIILSVVASAGIALIGGIALPSARKKADFRNYSENLEQARLAAGAEETLVKALRLYQVAEEQCASHKKDARYDLSAVRREKADVQSSMQDYAGKYAEWAESSEALFVKYHDEEAKKEAIQFYKKSLSFQDNADVKKKLSALENRN